MRRAIAALRDAHDGRHGDPASSRRAVVAAAVARRRRRATITRWLVPIAAIFAATSWGRDTLNNVGPHGFSEMLYEFSSASANNGSGFEGLGDNTVPWNVATGTVMLLARFLPIILPLAIAGALGAKRRTAQTVGTLGTEDGTFGLMLIATIVVFGALTFLPAAALGPIAEHLIFMH